MLSVVSADTATSLFVRKPEQYFYTLLLCGIPQATANYIFNLALFISANAGVSTIINQINILYVYFISTLRYNEEINYVCLLGGIILISGIYVTLFKK
jgi:drug/metabolite transporter (DMT)-like permease